MSIDLGLVRTWQGEPLAAAAGRVAAAGEQIQAELSALLAAGAGDPWHGEAAAAATRRHDDLLDEVTRLSGVVAEVEAALTVAAGRVQSAGDLARAGVHLAELHGLVVTDSGLVGGVTGVGGVGGVGGAGVGAAAPALDDAEALMQQALAVADRADADLSAALTVAASHLASSSPRGPVSLDLVDATIGTITAAPLAGGALPDGGSPAVLAWWGALSADGRRSAITDAPELVGGTDGIPAWARDRANRVRLRRAERDLTLEVERLRPPRGGGLFDVAGGLAGAATVGTLDGPTQRAAYLEAGGKLAAVQRVEQVLDQADGRDRQLLVLDVTGRSAKAVVAVGDVDRAEHVAVVVPGFTTTVQGDLAGSDAVAADLRDVARRESMAWGDHGEVAVVSWLGYDAPQVADILRSHSVVRRASAEVGAADLNPFLRGLPVGAHLTLVGHSYGSTTAGLTVAAGGTGVDDLVAIGSPGLGVDSAGALGLPPARVHVIEAADDPVAELGWFGRDPGHLAGVDRLAADAAPLTDGSLGLPSRGHSQYLSPGTTSQWNVAAVVAGVGTVAATRHHGPRVGQSR